MSDLTLTHELLRLTKEAVDLKRAMLRQHVQGNLRRHLRRCVAHGVHIKQVGEAEEDLARALAPVFEKQIKDMALQLKKMEGKNTDLQTKDASHSAASLVSQVADFRAMQQQIVDAALPVLAIKMIEAATAELQSLGVKVRHRKGVD